MKAIETMATINEKGELNLDRFLNEIKPQRVRVIVLMCKDDNEIDEDETPDSVVEEGIYQGIKEALTGKTIPLNQMWEGIDVE